jgi:predicted ATPase with chaperone activity
MWLPNRSSPKQQLQPHSGRTLHESYLRTIARSAVSELGLSARTHDKVIRVARTIADMESEAKIEPQHIEEAIQYRMLDRDVFN